MEPYAIGSASDTNLLKKHLLQQFDRLKEEGFRFALNEFTSGEYTFLGLSVHDTGQLGYADKEIRQIIRHFVAGAVADLIVDRWEEDLLWGYIHSNYYYFAPEEQHRIFALAWRELNGEGQEQLVVRKLLRKNRITAKVLDYLATNQELVVDGFLRFRLQEYLQELEQAVENAVDAFLLDREYQEFIRLLRYFVDIQEPRTPEVHIFFPLDRQFRLEDREGGALAEDFVDDWLQYQPPSEINLDDILVSALITLAPERLIIHKTPANRLKTRGMLKEIFGTRLQECSGCHRCLVH
ncbi:MULTISPECIES: putative sporulation protein YtxC [Carboxydocella]|uniref:Putative sporulation protein YtxC n=2 Tax=Carboxydocella TaxID=178898 RepID=A0A1T4Q000_9FIRM|nr:MULTISPECIES: putative sporulation protein YtxC [Carboxydocella]AVX21239.1 putative sporulation protein YtxC [Carboxydocella thermautotrophica]AVX31671.1 putative sporulation protein YtxC [Carboxydocella thermautotrophica]SJZ97102.1 putative sporulation protein YtxC [Carboxydocella sporoproducens DSM 16521]GAW29285.1 hypothetical protein ULO1_18550 [Carboxydocella sp. ULO1]GAW30763.1 hypothetical protein JDF658_05280 [Carboxydocella sp. JDF658]